ncbi:MAG TPA: enolase C-terminal domain-like protein [Chloroflexota bacterium]|jgi:L-alanine-DL-glutamate epimerase-like enolase superfamily enzyme
MKITGVKLLRLRGTMTFDGPFWEERLVRPVDLYPEHASQGEQPVPQVEPGKYRMESIFLRVETDSDGLVGIGGPVSHAVAYIVARAVAPHLIGHDPLAVERIWDRIYRQQIHGRKGDAMLALSAIDCALWDIRGKWANAPVYRLLGGPTRPGLPAYASMLGFSVDPSRARERADEYKQKGYGAQKWFFRHGPWAGRAGIELNVALVRETRAGVGYDYDLMFDAWSSWDVPYAVTLAERISGFRPRWLEEPVLADRIESYAEVKRRMPFPVAGGEHEYTRWGIKQLLDARACDVLQPDIYWAGGITEMLKIAALCSCYDVQLVPHGHSTPATAHFLLSQPASLCPIIEYLVKWNAVHQFFLASPLEPVDGVVTPPDRPGIGMELDADKAEQQEELTF